jgi:hypothetical protein
MPALDRRGGVLAHRLWVNPERGAELLPADEELTDRLREADQ